MKYSASVYGQALAEAIADTKGKDEGQLGKNFLALVRRNGDEASLKKILDEAARYLRKDTGVRKVTLMSARKLREPATVVLKNILRNGDVIEEKIDPDLIGGIKIIVDDELQFDGSLKGKLDTLFSNVI